MSTIISFYSKENDQTLIRVLESEDTELISKVISGLKRNKYTAFTVHKTLSLKPLVTSPIFGV